MKHFTVVIREQYEPAEKEAVIVTAALLEMDLAGLAPGVSVVQHVFELDSEAKREAFLDRSACFCAYFDLFTLEGLGTSNWHAKLSFQHLWRTA